jgi:hypothetical protein
VTSRGVPLLSAGWGLSGWLCLLPTSRIDAISPVAQSPRATGNVFSFCAMRVAHAIADKGTRRFRQAPARLVRVGSIHLPPLLLTAPRFFIV